MSRLPLFLLIMALLVFLPCLVYADCDNEVCAVDWSSKTPVKRSGLAQIDCGYCTHFFEATKYDLDDVGPDDCVTIALSFNLAVPPGEEAEIDWPGYGPIEIDPLDPVRTSNDCYDPVTKTTNHYDYLSSVGGCSETPSYDPDLYYSEIDTQYCCE